MIYRIVHMEFKKRISEANDTWADSASELARDCFNYGKE